MEIQENLNEKTIRLVYEKWENGNPLPNLSDKLGVESFRMEDSFFDFYERYYYAQLNFDRFSIKRSFHTIKDVYTNPHLKFYFFIKSSLHIDVIFTDINFTKGKPVFSDEIIKCLIDCPNLTVAFLTEHECDDEFGYMWLKNLANDNNIKESQFLLINNNSKLDTYNIKNNGYLQFHNLKLIPITSCSILYDLKPEFLEDKKGKFIICHNKSSKPHRYAMLILLFKSKLIEHVNWSLVSGQDRPVEDKIWLDNVLSKDMIEYCIDEIKFLYSIKVKESDFEKEKKYFKENGEFDFDKSVFPNLGPGSMASGGLLNPEDSFSYMHSYINLVTESEYRDSSNVVHITEKSFRPFAYYNLPVILATEGHVSFMKQKYGFDFYEDLINHDYDKELIVKDRILKIVEEIKRLCDNKNDVIKYYKSNKNRILKNNEIIREIRNDSSDFYFFKNLMS